jgi:cyclophilin family peptidyl-prolyl cis-trans isomerase
MLLWLPLMLALVQAPEPAAVASAEPTPRPLPNGPVVVIDTSLGKIKIGLRKDRAPISVDNFIKYVRAGHYDGTIFHRVIPDFMVQGGGFEPDMKERTQTLRPPIKNEAANMLRNSRGTIAMARTSAPNSATAQFYISVRDNHSLDYGIGGAGYAVFGEVLEGIDVVDKIVVVPTGTKGLFENVPLTPVVIKTIREVAGTAAPATPAKPTSAPAPKPAAPTTPSAPPKP